VEAADGCRAARGLDGHRTAAAAGRACRAGTVRGIGIRAVHAGARAGETVHPGWTASDQAHPHEALLGILALLHGASSAEVRHLRLAAISDADQTVRLGKRPNPVPLDPASWQVLQRCLAHRVSQRTANPHVIVTKGTKAGQAPASTAYMSHVLDHCDVPARTIRCTRLADLVNTLDPKLVAAAFGMNPEGVMIYIADHVDADRLPAHHGS
jgi:hypothetical protein